MFSTECIDPWQWCTSGAKVKVNESLKHVQNQQCTRKRNEIRMFITEKAKTQELNEKKDEEKKHGVIFRPLKIIVSCLKQGAFT